jgi:hypothetical protein
VGVKSGNAVGVRGAEDRGPLALPKDDRVRHNIVRSFASFISTPREETAMTLRDAAAADQRLCAIGMAIEKAFGRTPPPPRR